MRWWVPRLLAAVVTGLALGLAIDVARLGGPQAWLGRHQVPPPYVPGGQALVLDGHAFYLDCRGSGSPTVLLDAGLGTGAAGWGIVTKGVAARTRACLWDRPGIGASEGIGRHTGADTARLVRRALDEAGEKGPFLVVGHSLGAVYARLFADVHRSAVVGVVLVDPYTPDIRPVEHVDLAPALRREWLGGLEETGRVIAAVEQLDWDATEAELAATTLAGLPVELVFVDQRLRWTGAYEPWQDELIEAWRKLVTGLSSDVRLTIADGSGHMVQFDRPEVVVEAIVRLVERARGRP